jgi:hypothetical protein
MGMVNSMMRNYAKYVLLVCLLEGLERGSWVVQPRLDECNVKWRNVPLLRQRLQFVENF